jgi:serine acetyltransferase
MRIRTTTTTSARARHFSAQAQSVSTLDHLRYDLEENRHLGRKMFWLLTADFHRSRTKFGPLSKADQLFYLAFCWEWWAVAHYRLYHWACVRHIYLGPSRFQPLLVLQQEVLLRFCHILGRLVSGLSGARIEPQAEIGPGFLLVHGGSCGIGAGSRIGSNFTLFQDAGIIGRHGTQYPTIGDNVTVYSGARVIGPVHIGNEARIGSNAVVMHDIPEGCLALGVPAHPVEPGDKSPTYPATAQLADLLATLLDSGQLIETAPNQYQDTHTGHTFTAHFPRLGEVSTHEGNTLV